MSHTAKSIKDMEAFAASNDGRYPRFTHPSLTYISPLAGDEVAIQIEGDMEAFWIGGTNVSETDTMFDYEVLHPVTNVPMVPGADYTYHLEGEAVIFTKPYPGIGGKFTIRKRMPDRPQIRVVLLPKQIGYHTFADEVLQDFLADAIGKTHPLRKLIADPTYDMYNFATVLEAELTDKGIEALVELG